VTATQAQSEWIARVLGVGLTDASAGPDPGGAAVRLAKGMILWNQTRSYVSQQIKRLQDAILAQAENEPDYEDIAGNIGNLEDVLEVLDDRLTDKLNALRDTTDPTQKQALSEQARDVVLEYQSAIEANELINDIDDNGFVPLDIKPRVAATLDEVARTI
jgi:hypothetical protein